MKIAPIIGIILAVLLAVYSGSYLATVQPTEVVVAATAGIGIFEVEDYYRVGSPIAEWVFWPANQLDRRIRSDTWAATDNLPSTASP